MSAISKLAAIAGAVLLVTASALVGDAHAATPPLTLNIAGNGSLEVVLGNGTRLRTSTAPGAVIPPGPYLAIVASDVPDTRDIYHMFHLFGPGVNVSSELLPCENPAPVNTVTLLPNSTYTYEDSRHPEIAHVVFSTSGSGSSADTAGSAGGPATAKATGAVSNSSLVGSAIKQLRGTLVGTLTAAGTPALSLNGKIVSSLKSGRYKLTVDDKTAKGGLLLQKLHRPSTRVTGSAFVGKKTLTVSLSAGEWVFYSTTGPKRSFVVT